jgi:hypothetical protein
LNGFRRSNESFGGTDKKRRCNECSCPRLHSIQLSSGLIGWYVCDENKCHHERTRR